MSKKRLILAVAAALVAVLVIVRVGCQAPTPEERIGQDLSERLDKMVSEASAEDSLLDYVDQADIELMQKFGVDAQAWLTSWLDGLSYEVGDIDVAEDAQTASAHITLRCKSLAAILSAWDAQLGELVASGEVADTDELYARAGSLFMELTDAAELADFDTTVDYTKNDKGDWEISDALVDNLYALLVGA